MAGHWYVAGLLGLGALALAYVFGFAAPEERPRGDPDFLPQDATLQLLVDGDDQDLIFTEGVVVTCDRRVLFSDIPAAGAHGERRAGRILEYHPDTRTISVFRSPSNGANGNRMDLACRLLSAERHRLVRTDLVTGGIEVVLGAGAGDAFDALNDIAVDSKGRIYVTHPRYGAVGPGSLRERGVYRIDPDRRVTRVISDAARPNGIAICPDQRHIAVGSYQHDADVDREMALLRYDLAPDGTAGNRRVLVDYAPEDGPDGLACDSEGNLWVAVRDRGHPGIYAYSVTGGVARERAYIPTPELPTNVHFGRGDAANYLYVTAGNNLYGIRVGKRGHHPQRRSSATKSPGIAAILHEAAPQVVKAPFTGSMRSWLLACQTCGRWRWRGRARSTRRCSTTSSRPSSSSPSVAAAWSTPSSPAPSSRRA